MTALAKLDVHKAANFLSATDATASGSSFVIVRSAPEKKTPKYAFGHLRVHGWMSGGGEHLKDEVSKHSCLLAY